VTISVPETNYTSNGDSDSYAYSGTSEDDEDGTLTSSIGWTITADFGGNDVFTPPDGAGGAFDPLVNGIGYGQYTFEATSTDTYGWTTVETLTVTFTTP
jgi:hypothetical protein